MSPRSSDTDEHPTAGQVSDKSDQEYCLYVPSCQHQDNFTYILGSIEVYGPTARARLGANCRARASDSVGPYVSVDPCLVLVELGSRKVCEHAILA